MIRKKETGWPHTPPAVLIMLSSPGCVYGSGSVPPEQKRAKMAYSDADQRKYVYPLFHLGRVCEVCAFVYPQFPIDRPS